MPAHLSKSVGRRLSRTGFARLALLPLAIVATAFFLLPMIKLVIVGASGEMGLGAYAAILFEPRYRASLISTVVLAAVTTIAALAAATIAGLFLQRHRFPGRAVLIAMLTFPLAFPGVVVGFMIILLAGRQGLVGDLTSRLLGEKLDPALEEAARTLGAGPWAVHRDVIFPALGPAFVASGAIVFATAMGAFGTAFTLATNIDVLPMVIYTEFTLSANIAMAAALSVGLGVVAWASLAFARSLSGGTVAAAG